jgi:hypothetical protein
VGIEPGRIPAFLTNVNVGLLRAEDRVFEAMLDGWRAQMLARGLSTSHCRLLTVLREGPRTQYHP